MKCVILNGHSGELMNLVRGGCRIVIREIEIAWLLGTFCYNNILLLDRTRRAWVAPARDDRYVLGQLRSRTAGVSFLSFWDGVCRHSLNGPKIGEMLFCRQIIPLPRKRTFLRHLENRLKNNLSGICLPGRGRYHSVFCPFFHHIGRTDT